MKECESCGSCINFQPIDSNEEILKEIRDRHQCVNFYKFWKFKANFLINVFKGLLNKHKLKTKNINDCGVSAIDFHLLCLSAYKKMITKKQLKTVIEKAIIKHKSCMILQDGDY